MDSSPSEGTNMTIRILFLLLTLALVGCDRQDADWEQAQQQNTIAAYEEFVERYPESPQAEQARSRIEAQRAEQAWTDARQRNTVDAYRDFLQSYPDAAAADQAREQLATLERAAAWGTLADSEEISALRAFADKYGESEEAAVARRRISELEARAAEAEQRQRELELERQRERERELEDQARREAQQGSHRVQLAVLRGQDQANQGAEMLAQRLGDVLGDVALEVQPSNGRYRLVTEPMSREQANTLCGSLKQRGQDCLVRQR